MSTPSLARRQPVWHSDKLPGVTLRGYHPVVAPDGSVMVTVTPAVSLDRMEPSCWTWSRKSLATSPAGATRRKRTTACAEANFELMNKADTYRRQLDYLRKRLTDEPAFQTFFVLDPATGKQRLWPRSSTRRA